MNLEIKNFNVVLKKAIIQKWKTEKYSYKHISRPDYGFLYLAHGFMTYEFENHLLKVKAGDIIYLPKNSQYEVYFNPIDRTVENILINFETVGEDSFLGFSRPVKIYSDRNQEFYNCFLDVVEAYTNQGKTFLPNLLMNKCFYALQKQVCMQNKDEEVIALEKGALLLSEEFDVSIEDICVALNMSRSVFQRKFKKYYGMAPITYRTTMRMKKAKLILETTDMPVKEITEMLGYYDLAYFSKVFEKITGLTPKKYRKRSRELL